MKLMMEHSRAPQVRPMLWRARPGHWMDAAENAQANSLVVLLEELDLLRARVSAALVLANLGPVEILTIKEIQLRVATVFKLHPNHMIMPARGAENIAVGRMVAMSLAREFTELSLGAIGREFGQRNHGTVLNALKRVAELCETDVRIRNVMTVLRASLRRGEQKET